MFEVQVSQTTVIRFQYEAVNFIRYESFADNGRSN